jgi:hypothetical protein
MIVGYYVPPVIPYESAAGSLGHFLRSVKNILLQLYVDDEYHRTGGLIHNRDGVLLVLRPPGCRQTDYTEYQHNVKKKSEWVFSYAHGKSPVSIIFSR